MSYLVIARKYRPLGFDDIAGQETIVQTLKNAIDEGRISHAYLFSGMRGVGKTSMARIFARALNCRNDGPTSSPCNSCESCVDIISGHSMDVIEIDGASNRRVEETQQLIENVRYAPARDRYKVYIIDEVHMLSSHAFNALLKTLEEPPSHVIFIMATTEYHKIPQTIISRTQHFHFANIPANIIIENLKGISKKEGIKITDQALSLITRAASGSIRDAQSLLDQVIAFAGKDVNEKDVESVLGTINRDLIRDIIRGIGSEDAAGLIETVSRAVGEGFDLILVIRELIDWFRSLIFMSIDHTKLSSLINASGQNVEELKEMTDTFTLEQLLLIFDLLAQAENMMKISTYPRFIIETYLVKAAYSNRIMDIGMITDESYPRGGGGRIQSKGKAERKISSAAVDSMYGDEEMSSGLRITGLTPFKTMTDKEVESLRGRESTSDKNQALMKKIMDVANKKSKIVYSMLGNSERLAIEDGKLAIYRSHKAGELATSILEKAEYKKVLDEILEELLGPGGGFIIKEYIPGDLDISTTAAQNSEELRKAREIEELMQDPIIQKVVDRFHGEIKDIKKLRD